MPSAKSNAPVEPLRREESALSKKLLHRDAVQFGNLRPHLVFGDVGAALGDGQGAELVEVPGRELLAVQAPGDEG